MVGSDTLAIVMSRAYMNVPSDRLRVASARFAGRKSSGLRTGGMAVAAMRAYASAVEVGRDRRRARRVHANRAAGADDRSDQRIDRRWVKWVHGGTQSRGLWRLLRQQGGSMDADGAAGACAPVDPGGSVRASAFSVNVNRAIHASRTCRSEERRVGKE